MDQNLDEKEEGTFWYEIQKQIAIGEITPRQGYDKYIESGVDPLLARELVWESLGGRDAIYTEEDRANNQRVEELTKDLPK